MAAQIRYRGGIDHTQKTIELLFKTEYYTYEKARLLVRMGVGFALIVAGALLKLPMWAKTMMMLIGCWLVVSKDFPSMTRADRVIDARHGDLPKMRYEFCGDHVRVSGEGSMQIEYKKFTRLVEDSGYLYLFLDRDSVCMVDRATLTPPPAEDFKSFIAKRTGLSWTRQKSLLTMNLQDVLQIFRDRKEDRHRLRR